MPEGPEVAILALAFKKLGFETMSYGKHLLLTDDKTYDISFGLVGKIHVDKDLIITKVTSATQPSGDMKIIENFNSVDTLGLDWIKATRDEIKHVVTSWTKRRRMIGALLLDQSEICGIGVVWGGEILHVCGLKPYESLYKSDINMCDSLTDAITTVRDGVMKRYIQELEICRDYRQFINSWYKNLYDIREMKVYGKGTKVKVSGRNFYI